MKAVLSGEGADELFCGYTWHRSYAQECAGSASSWGSRWRTELRPWKRPWGVERYAEAMAMGRFTRTELLETLHQDLHAHIAQDPEWFYSKYYNPFLTPVKSIQVMDIKLFMGELVLTKIDRASMANSLEVRVPFLDHELFEYLFRLNESVYYRPEGMKYLLRENIKNHIPDRILKRPNLEIPP